MSNPDKIPTGADPLQKLIAAHHAGKLSRDELIARALPWLEERRQNKIQYYMAKLAGDYPRRYHTSNPKRRDLWKDAVDAFDLELKPIIKQRPDFGDKLGFAELNWLFRLIAQRNYALLKST